MRSERNEVCRPCLEKPLGWREEGGGGSRSERGKGKEGEKEREGGRKKERERYIAEDECVLAFGSILRDSSNFINHPSFSNLVCQVE